jgi:hypothetical protein
MLQRAKYNKTEEYVKYKSNLTTSFQSSKYHHKKKLGISKKVSNQWKKQNSSKNWNKENDSNYLNYDYYYLPKEKKEKNNYYNSFKYSNNKFYQKSEKNNENFEKNKNDKKMSFDNDATTQSNSSFHEHEQENEEIYDNNKKNEIQAKNNNEYISIKFKEINSVKEFNKMNSINNINNKDINDINLIINNDKNIDNINNINNIIMNSFKNLNLNSNSVNNNKKRQKNQKKKKPTSSEIKKSFSENINEPYNKFNSINNELISQCMNPLIENTEILNIKVKIEKNNYVIFKLRRFDDLFLTVKLFCEINSIEEKLIKPIITMVLCGLNTIYQIYNTKLEINNIHILKKIKNSENIDFQFENYFNN